MTLKYIIDSIKSIALLQPNVRTATEGDVYNTLNGNPQTKYSVFHVTQNAHKEQDNIDYYSFNLFYIDRLLDDYSNKLEIQSIGKELISNVLKSLDETFETETSEVSFQPFTEKFNDLCAGVYANVIISCVQDTTCAEQYGEFVKPIIKIINNQDITITENGTYFPQEGYSGFGKVDVNIDTDSFYQEGYNEGFSKGETEGYETGYNEGYGEGVANAEEEIAESAQVLYITKNGTYKTKFSEVTDSDVVITGYFDDGTPFYDYGFCNQISYDTGIQVSPTTKIELWYKSNDYRQYDVPIIGSQSFENTDAIFKLIENEYNIEAHIKTDGVVYSGVQDNKWYHLKMSYEEGFWVNDEFIGDWYGINDNVVEPFTNLFINNYGSYNQTGSDNYYGMIKIDGQTIIPTELGFYNVTTDKYLDVYTSGDYVYTKGSSTPVLEGNLIKEVTVEVDTSYFYSKGYDEGYMVGEISGYETGYSEGVEQGKEEQKSLLEPITITENGVFTNENGYSEITVDVPTGGGGEGDYEEGYNKGYEEGIANAEEEIAETAQVLRITENGRYTTKFSEMSDSDAVITGYFDDGTPFYNYGFCNQIAYNTGIKVSPTTTLELWYKTDNWEEVDTAIVASQSSRNYNAIFKIVKNRGKAKAEIAQLGTETPFTMTNGEWYHFKLSYEEGFWINDEFINNNAFMIQEPTFELCINSFREDMLANSSSNAYYGMIKIDNQIIIPTEQGFYNVTTDSYLDAINPYGGEYVYTEAKSDFTGNLIKEVIVEVPTSTVEGEYTQEEVDEMCTSVYEASSEILDYLNSTGENVEYTIEENGHYTYEADTYFNEVTINIKVPTSSGEDALHNFNDLGYQTDDVVYMGNPATMKDDLDYSYNKKVEFDGTTNYFNNDTQLVYAPYINFEGVESDSLDSFFAGCENMLCVPHYTLWWETHYADRFFENCSKLKSFKITSTYIDSINYMCSNCVNLNEFSIYSESESIGAEGAFYNCHNLEYIPQIGSLGEFYLINSDTFYSCFKLKKIENIINSYGTIYGFIYCYSLEDVKIKLNDSGDFDIDLSYSPKLKWDCVKFLIDNADEGYSHTIKLHSSLEEKYHQESDFETYMTMAEERGITFEYVSIEIPTEYL